MLVSCAEQAARTSIQSHARLPQLRRWSRHDDLRTVRSLAHRRGRIRQEASHRTAGEDRYGCHATRVRLDRWRCHRCRNRACLRPQQHIETERSEIQLYLGRLAAERPKGRQHPDRHSRSGQSPRQTAERQRAGDDVARQHPALPDREQCQAVLRVYFAQLDADWRRGLVQAAKHGLCLRSRRHGIIRLSRLVGHDLQCRHQQTGTCHRSLALRRQERYRHRLLRDGVSRERRQAETAPVLHRGNRRELRHARFWLREYRPHHPQFRRAYLPCGAQRPDRLHAGAVVARHRDQRREHDVLGPWRLRHHGTQGFRRCRSPKPSS